MTGEAQQTPSDLAARPHGNLNRPVLTAFLSSGALWIAGCSVAMHGGGFFLPIAATIYVTLGSVALSSAKFRTAPTVQILWAISVLLLVVILIPVAGWVSLLIGGILGSVLFAAWSLTGFFLLQAFTGRAFLDPSHYDSH